MEDSEPADPEGMKRLGSQLRAAGDLDGAERWFQRAADAGSIGALYNLGLVAKDRGDSETAERRFLRVAEMGDADAMVHVGRFRSDEGDLDAAEHWYRKAAETGNLMGVANVGSILQKRGDLAGAKSWFLRAADAGNAGAMGSLGYLFEIQGETENAKEWYAKGVEAGDQYSMQALPSLDDRMHMFRRLREIDFDTFGWELVQDDDEHRLWQSTDGILVERFFDFEPDFEAWDADQIREDALEMQGFANSPTFTLADVPEVLRKYVPSELPQQISLLDVDLFEVSIAKGVLMTSRHRAHGDVHYAASILLMFAECFWWVGIEVREGSEVGKREGAVASVAMNTPTDGTLLPAFDPYEREWDGIVPLVDDPLSRLRILGNRLVRSIKLGDGTADLHPFEPGQ
jgi:tetratricopeptide (TPR) repeat protein